MDDELKRIKELLETHHWQFAKTMPHNPHFYTLRAAWNEQEFIDVVLYIRKHGVQERYPVVRGRWYTVLQIGEYKYWTMGCPIIPGSLNPSGNTILINRKVVRDEPK